MSTLNTGQFVSSRRGGTLKITDNESGTVYTVSGVEEDSFTHTPGMYAALFDTEKGAPTRERRGDAQRSSISCRFKQTPDMWAAGSLFGLLVDQVKAADDGLLRTFTVVWEQSDHAGVSAGEKITYNNCAVVSVQSDSGADYNTISVSWSSRDAFPAYGTML